MKTSDRKTSHMNEAARTFATKKWALVRRLWAITLLKPIFFEERGRTRSKKGLRRYKRVL